MAQSLKRKASTTTAITVLLYQEKSPFLSLGTFNSSFSTVEQDPSNHPPKRIECAIKKVTFVTIKKELSCIIIELLANIFGKKILKILKMTFMVELPAQKNRQESQKINSNFLTQQVTLSVEKKLFFLYIHTCLFYSIRVLKSKNDMNLHFNWILFSFSRSILSSKPYVEFLIFV